jgi:hypothetical protein
MAEKLLAPVGITADHDRGTAPVGGAGVCVDVVSQDIEHYPTASFSVAAFAFVAKECLL